MQAVPVPCDQATGGAGGGGVFPVSGPPHRRKAAHIGFPTFTNGAWNGRSIQRSEAM